MPPTRFIHHKVPPPPKSETTNPPTSSTCSTSTDLIIRSYTPKIPKSSRLTEHQPQTSSSQPTFRVQLAPLAPSSKATHSTSPIHLSELSEDSAHSSESSDEDYTSDEEDFELQSDPDNNGPQPDDVFQPIPYNPTALISAQKLAPHTTLKWTTLEEAEKWMKEEAEVNVFNFSSCATRRPKPGSATTWLQKRRYICSRGTTGGPSKYSRKTKQKRKVPSKKTGCSCRLTLSIYKDRVEGFYRSSHNHPLGNSNARFTAISQDTRHKIEAMLRLGLDPDAVLESIHGNLYDEINFEVARSQGRKSVRDDFVNIKDVRRIQKILEQKNVRLAPTDGPSVLKWVQQLQDQGHFVFLKASNSAPPPQSNLAADVFILIIQTRYQSECWEKHGRRFGAIDGTHNTTHYENMTLFTLIAWDRWGHGIPCAWMISSNATENTISFFARQIQSRFPNISPDYFMTDKDQAQINSLKQCFPRSAILLCWWHVLHAWQQHFSTSAFPELWTLLKRWVRITDKQEFDRMWDKIKVIAPTSVVEYLTTNWLGDETVKQWSAVYRTDRSIFQDSDTNMLVEAWHHVLKGKFMQGKRNRRLDHLIYILVLKVMPYFLAKHQYQESGFAGPDLEVQERRRIEELAAKIDPNDIQQSSSHPDDPVFQVKSQSNPSLTYTVDLDQYECNCPSFTRITMCKHILAAQQKHPEICNPITSSALDISSSDTFEHNGSTSSYPTSAPVQDHTKDLISSLSTLIYRLHHIPHSMVDSSKVLELKESLSKFSNTLPSITDTDILPSKKTIAPNQGSWSETASVMGVKPKAKRKVHTDAYAGGERAGKRAKKDALTAPLEPQPLPQTTLPAQSSTSPSNSIPPTMLDKPALAVSTSLYQNRAPLAAAAPSQPLFIPSDVSFLSRIQSDTFTFDPATFDLGNSQALCNLKRLQLDKLCTFYNVRANGPTNIEKIASLSGFYNAQHNN
ncbi:hypothetical protein CVT24_002240 [Panaeolus cyanescens]|uniref:SWIM-type domain-containing protein n=1 Tax=Panaeolus cyanescens TaxID=181874 RepID=A0A409YIE3_9AGAR|nr:hypothetical protein CVT24_002240 [Panaeolus cyanescens]